MTWQLVAAFDVLGDPKGQPRPRAFARGGHAAVYNPDTADAWKAEIRAAAELPAEPIEGPVKLVVAFFFKRPVKQATKKRAGIEIPHISKPDIDNALKAAMDALTEAGAWRDDSQVQEIHAEKWYTLPDRPAGALIQIFKAVP